MTCSLDSILFKNLVEHTFILNEKKTKLVFLQLTQACYHRPANMYFKGCIHCTNLQISALACGLMIACL
uniref:Uncharacterized protein n=1 Tax=Anguilla anguilla TaxID=7936 RepID=A0A0E9WGD7_ANGAN